MMKKGALDTVSVQEFSDKQLKAFMDKNSISLKISEAREVAKLLERNPTLTELHIFNTEWSEHCSYKSSREVLKMLPTEGPTVLLGPKEDAGIIYLTTIDNERYGIVMAHESHNHPSQIVPYEGAATGVGGIVRDVLCMGARVIATGDPLRFGDPNGKDKQRVKYIANAVIDGIAGYGNPIGIPNLAGDVYFNSSFDDNCLVNVVCLGLIKEKDIIHSAAPEDAEDHDIVIVGKATDNSGFGGAAFSSLILDEEDKEANKGAVQVPDPFLKNILIRATEAVFKEAKEKGVSLGFKDMGAGGIMCSTSELCEAGGYGAKINLDKVHVSMKKLPPYIIACSETQERFSWIVPPSFSQRLLEIYNEDFALPDVAEGAKATVVGKVTRDTDYVMNHEGKIVCQAPVKVITKGIKYTREKSLTKEKLKEPSLKEPKDYHEMVLKVLHHPNVASKAKAFKHYDTEVQGLAVIRPGEADAGVMAPIPGHKIGIALSTDANPRFSRINPYQGGILAVAEAMRNVAAVGATPYGMTDCLNFGNPEKPEQFAEFYESVRGIADAANNIWLKGKPETAVPFVSGNVSFYNESAKGKSIDPSPIIACLGVMEDYSKAITMKLKEEDNQLFLIGKRKNELGGSVYYDLHDELGSQLPEIDFEQERNKMYAVIDAIDKRLIKSCHDISDGGFAAAMAEMILGKDGDGAIGAIIDLKDKEQRVDTLLFSETPGFIIEIDGQNIKQVEKILKKYSIEMQKLGITGSSSLKIKHDSKLIIDLAIKELSKAWTTGFGEALA